MTRIYNYYKKYGYKTQVMGASFRKVEQILALAGCDLLTISPDLLEKLQDTPGEVTPRLRPERASRQASRGCTSTRRPSAGCTTRTPMAVEKLSDGIRRFNEDARKLEGWAAAELTAA